MELLNISPEQIAILCQKAKEFKMKALAIFGSFARNEAISTSDLDLLGEFKEFPTFLEFIHMENDLSSVLHLKVDLITRNSLNKFIKPQILSEMQIIYSEI